MPRWKRTRRQNAGPSSRRSLLFADTSGIPCEEMPSQLDAIAESFVEQRVSGVMFHPVDFCTSAGKANALVVARFREAGIPVVLLDCDIAFDRMLQMIWFAAMHKVGVGGRSGAKGLSRGLSLKFPPILARTRNGPAQATCFAARRFRSGRAGLRACRRRLSTRLRAR